METNCSQTTETRHELATLAGGCFWCLEAVFSQLKGVLHVESGYSNGHHPRPTYEDVCTGETGHAEVVQITFDPTVIRFTDLLTVFFETHDPTTRNRQGHDVGTQYRSGIYTHSPEQADQAREVIRNLTDSGAYTGSIVTEVHPVTNYHPAEAFHARYAERNPEQGYCVYVVAPKVAHFRQRFGHWLQNA
ncbi:MAG: peptide-methionine (S)-S-oxide reductase MsrA [Aquabacterium sp.]|uniref:peptide-methionine (S)-S-oxide reductase MsrA n=1 Tax=Aquabacterium sp. TaxID=1872578 RepID=UPI003BDF13AD